MTGIKYRQPERNCMNMIYYKKGLTKSQLSLNDYAKKCRLLMLLLTEQRKKNGKYVSDEIDVPPDLDIS
jgi:hypothetical protein